MSSAADAYANICQTLQLCKERQTSKVETGNVIASALKIVSESQIAEVVEKLSLQQADQLLRHIYAGLAVGQASLSSVMLRWHEYVVGRNGLGCILRVMTANSS